jgi:hypothetical protein
MRRMRLADDEPHPPFDPRSRFVRAAGLDQGDSHADKFRAAR